MRKTSIAKSKLNHQNRKWFALQRKFDTKYASNELDHEIEWNEIESYIYKKEKKLMYNIIKKKIFVRNVCT